MIHTITVSVALAISNICLIIIYFYVFSFIFHMADSQLQIVTNTKHCYRVPNVFLVLRIVDSFINSSNLLVMHGNWVWWCGRINFEFQIWNTGCWIFRCIVIVSWFEPVSSCCDGKNNLKHEIKFEIRIGRIDFMESNRTKNNQFSSALLYTYTHSRVLHINCFRGLNQWHKCTSSHECHNGKWKMEIL